MLRPTEFKILSNYISIEDINKIALENNIQNTKFEVQGLGNGSTKISNIGEFTYFVIVRADELLNIRKLISNVCVEAGMDSSSWNYSKYNPHITIGYTKRDLHEEDGVIKNSSSKIADIKVTR